MQCWQDCAVPIFTLLHAHHPALVPPYPDYFTIIKEPIALLHKHTISVSYYKTILWFHDDYRLMHANITKKYLGCMLMLRRRRRCSMFIFDVSNNNKLHLSTYIEYYIVNRLLPYIAFELHWQSDRHLAWSSCSTDTMTCVTGPSFCCSFSNVTVQLAIKMLWPFNYYAPSYC